MTRECARQPQESADPRRWTALAVLSVAQFMLILDRTVVNASGPDRIGWRVTNRRSGETCNGNVSV